MRNTTLTVLSLSLFVAGSHLLAAHADHAREQPNIVLFFVDDLGWTDLGFRNPTFESPNIDQLVRDGMSFEQAYIASPTCSPGEKRCQVPFWLFG